MRILIADDDPIYVAAVRATLRAGGVTCQCDHAADGHAAWAALSPAVGGDMFDVVLLDHHMPGRDGLDVLGAYRAAGGRTPVIVMTAAGDEEVAVAMMKAGATDYLPKSKLTPETLRHAVVNAVRLGQAERRAAESAAALRDGERLNRGVLDALTSHVAVLDRDGRIAAVNAAWERFRAANGGAGAEAAVGTDYLAHVPAGEEAHAATDGGGDPYDEDGPNVAPRGLAARMRAVLDGTAPAFEHEYPCHSPTERRWFVMQFAPLPGGGAVVTHSDVTARRLAEIEFRRNHETLETIFEHIPVMIAVFDPRGRAARVNRAFSRTLGWSIEQWRSQDVMALMYPDPQERLRIRRFIDAATGEWGDFKTRTAGGQVIETTWANVRLSDGHNVGIGVDVSARRRAEAAAVAAAEREQQLREQFVHAQRMESIGRLAAGIAHDFGNVLAVVSGYADAFVRRAGDDPSLRACADEIVKATERGGALARQLMTFGRGGGGGGGTSSAAAAAAPSTDLNEVVASMHKMLRGVIGHRVNILTRRSGDGGPCLVAAEAGHVEQVIMNLAINARDAMPDGGTLTIEISPDAGPADDHTSPAAASPKAFARLTVRDTGRGMDAATRARIFEPYFTTKGDGNGVGLSVVQGVVRQYGGEVRVHSEPGRGTRFDVLLPRAA